MLSILTKSASDFIALHAGGILPSQRASSDANLSVTSTTRLQAAGEWLLRSIKVCNGSGSSKGYHLLYGWLPAYPETSGYIIPTLMLLGEETNDESFTLAAASTSDWLLGVQFPTGGFPAGESGTGTKPDVFDTGMVLLGFNALMHQSGSPRLRLASGRAAEFLASSLDKAGCFVRHSFRDIPHAYNVRAAWALAAYGKLTNAPRYVNAAIGNGKWTCAQQNERGFFANNAFKPGANANTHGTAYVLRGLLQIYELTNEHEFLHCVLHAAEALKGAYQRNGWIAAELGPDWRYLSSHICLTGYAQLALVFFRLSQLTGEQAYREVAERLVADVSSRQELSRANSHYHGAIAGSFPIYGRYAPLQYPNWATKFLVDALITQVRLSRGGARSPWQLYSG